MGELALLKTVFCAFGLLSSTDSKKYSLHIFFFLTKNQYHFYTKNTVFFPTKDKKNNLRRGYLLKDTWLILLSMLK